MSGKGSGGREHGAGKESRASRARAHTACDEEGDEIEQHGGGNSGGGRRKESASGGYRGVGKAKGSEFRHLRDDLEVCDVVFRNGVYMGNGLTILEVCASGAANERIFRDAIEELFRNPDV